jgi:hypothetical protein
MNLRFSHWPDDHFSVVTVNFTPGHKKNVVWVELTQEAVPLIDKFGNTDEHKKVETGWQAHFWCVVCFCLFCVSSYFVSIFFFLFFPSSHPFLLLSGTVSSVFSVTQQKTKTPMMKMISEALFLFLLAPLLSSLVTRDRQLQLPHLLRENEQLLFTL